MMCWRWAKSSAKLLRLIHPAQTEAILLVETMLVVRGSRRECARAWGARSSVDGSRAWVARVNIESMQHIFLCSFLIGSNSYIETQLSKWYVVPAGAAPRSGHTLGAPLVVWGRQRQLQHHQSRYGHPWEKADSECSYYRYWFCCGTMSSPGSRLSSITVAHFVHEVQG